MIAVREMLQRKCKLQRNEKRTLKTIHEKLTNIKKIILTKTGA